MQRRNGASTPSSTSSLDEVRAACAPIYNAPVLSEHALNQLVVFDSIGRTTGVPPNFRHLV